MNNYLDKDLIKVEYQNNFGLHSSKRGKDGKIHLCRFYSENTKNFVQKYDIEKLDDISDCLLMLLYV